MFGSYAADISAGLRLIGLCCFGSTVRRCLTSSCRVAASPRHYRQAESVILLPRGLEM